MSSQQKTAEYFRNKSDEEIIDWMLKNLSTEQIKTCLDNDSPQPITPIKKEEITVDDLRKWCSNKQYVIQDLKDGKVYFWYFQNKAKKWTYYVLPVDEFPQSMGATAEECDPKMELDSKELDELREYWNDKSLGSNENYNSKKLQDMPTSQQDAFNETINKYEFNQNLEPKASDTDKSTPDKSTPDISKALDGIQKAINDQKQTPVDPDSKLAGVINFAPVLIESVYPKNTVNYYYLTFNQDDQSFKVNGNVLNTDVASISLDDCKDKFLEILTNFSKLEEYISTPGAGGGSDDLTKSAESWKADIKQAVNNFFTGNFAGDLNTIKALYEVHPLIDLEGSKYFMSGLFSTSQFGKKPHNNDIIKDVTNYYGKKFTELFKPKVIENKFGYKTLIYTN